MIDSDEEIIFEDGDFDDSQLQHDFEMLDDNWTSISMMFNPYQCEVKKLKVCIIFHPTLHYSTLLFWTFSLRKENVKLLPL